MDLFLTFLADPAYMSRSFAFGPPSSEESFQEVFRRYGPGVGKYVAALAGAVAGKISDPLAWVVVTITALMFVRRFRLYWGIPLAIAASIVNIAAVWPMWQTLGMHVAWRPFYMKLIFATHFTIVYATFAISWIMAKLLTLLYPSITIPPNPPIIRPRLRQLLDWLLNTPRRHLASFAIAAALGCAIGLMVGYLAYAAANTGWANSFYYWVDSYFWRSGIYWAATGIVISACILAIRQLMR